MLVHHREILKLIEQGSTDTTSAYDFIYSRYQMKEIYINNTNLNFRLYIPYLEKRVPQSQRYSRVPHIFECAFQSDWTAYFLEHFSHFHFFSPCLRLKCFLIPVRSPSARAGSWCTQLVSGQMYTFLRKASLLLRCFSFHGRLWPRRCNCRFWSRWNPLLQISQMKRFVAMRVCGDSAITSASGSVYA